MKTAAAYAGIHVDTIENWIKRGAQAEQNDDTTAPELPYRAFYVSVQEAFAAAEIRDVALIGKAATDQWQAAAWRLERRYPEKWGRRERHEHSGPEGGPVQHEIVAQVVVLPPLDDSDSPEAGSDLEAQSGPTDTPAGNPGK